MCNAIPVPGSLEPRYMSLQFGNFSKSDKFEMFDFMQKYDFRIPWT